MCSDSTPYASRLLCPFIFKKKTLKRTYSYLGCCFPRLGSYTGKDSEVTPILTRKFLFRLSASTKLSGFTFCILVALVTKKHMYFPGICDATGGSAIMPSSPGLCSIKTCAMLPDWHSAAFRRNTEIEVEALMVENYCKGGSGYSGILDFQNFD